MKKAEEFIADKTFQNWANNSNREDTEFWDHWIAQHPEQEEEIELAASIIRGIEFKKVQGLSDSEIRSRFEMLKQTMQDERKQRSAVVINWAVVYRVAAAFAGIAVVGFVLWTSGFLGSTTTYSTDFGEKAHITLPDGSGITLNANSTLSFTEPWDHDQPREVWLSGEGFFNVDKQLKTNPPETTDRYVKFIVHTSDVNVEVLGTEFNIHNRRGETRVVLSSGKVELTRPAYSDTTRIIMNPGDLVKVSERSNAFDRYRVDPGTHTSWIEDKLIFDSTPLTDIILILEDNFGFKTRIRDPSLMERKLTGELSVESADDLIKALSIALNIKITKTDKELVLESH